MDALAMLREDHRKVRELFRQFEEAQDKATKKAAAETALVELNIHSILEEEISIRLSGARVTAPIRSSSGPSRSTTQPISSWTS
jgi:hypothetical protein